MWEFTFKFSFVWSLFLFLNCLGKPNPIGALSTNLELDLNLNSGVNWDWMQTGQLGMAQGGSWLRSSLCPGGSFVTGYEIKYGQGSTAGEVTGLRLHCSKLDQKYQLKTVEHLIANGASISNQNSVSVSSNRPAVGFSMARWLDAEGFEFVGGRRLKFLGEGESGKYKSRFKFQTKSNTTFSVHLRCPEDWAVCGMQSREKAANDADSEPILTQLRLKCCYYCIPQEKRVILDDYTNPGSTDYSRTIRRTVGAQFDRRKSTAGSNSQSRDKTNESQVGNSKTLSSSTSESDGQTNSNSEGQSDSKGWNTGEELRISTSNQNSKDSRVADSTSTSESNSRSIGKSTSKIDSSHWSNTAGDSSSHTVDAGGEFSYSAGVSAGIQGVFGAETKTSLTLRAGYSYNKGYHEDNTKGGSGTNEGRESEDATNTEQRTGSTDVSAGNSNTESRGNDTSATRGTSGGTALNKEQSRQISIQRAKEQSIQQGAQSMFTQRQADQQSWQFNWDQSDSSMWREEREDTYAFTCEAMQRCKIEQVYGTCGALQIATPKIEKRIDLLQYGLYGDSPQPEPEPETGSNKTKEIQWDINIPRETWVVVKDLSHWEPSGRWENIQVCPPNTIVTGHMFKYFSRAGLTGITLFCSGQYGPDEGESEHDHVNILRISPEGRAERNRTRGLWGNIKRGSRSIFAEGYSFAQREMNGRRSMGNQEIIYNNITLMNISNSFAVNSSRVVTKCPIDHAICGLTAMMDEAGIGILTALGFKCCHHCIPEEKWVNVHEYENQSPSDEVREIRTTVGLTRSQTNVESNSVNNGSSTDSAGISRSGLHAGFSARFGKSSSTGFDWTHTKSSVWNDETTVTERFVCEGFSSCVYRKLEGQCGSVRVPVDKFQKVSVPIEGHSSVSAADPDSSEALDQETETTPTTRSGSRAYQNEYHLEDELTPVQVLKTGEIWIEAQNIQNGNGDEDTIWGNIESCPSGTFVTGYRLQKLGGEDEDTKELLSGVELECSRWDAQEKFKQVKFIQSEQSSSRSGHSSSDANPEEDIVRNEDDATLKPAVGFNFFSYEWFDDDGEQLGQSTTGHSLIFDRRSSPDPPIFENTDYQVKVFPEKFTCPTDYVICGVRTRKDANTGVLTDVKFQCCYHCEPSEVEEQLDHQENPTDAMVAHTIPPVKIGAVVEVKNPIVEGSTHNSFILVKGFSDYQYIKAMFAHRLPKTSKRPGPGQPRVDWKKQPKSLWTREIEIPKVNHCKAGHTCVVSQLVGLCGKLYIPTSFMPTQYMLIDEAISEEEEEEKQEDYNDN